MGVDWASQSHHVCVLKAAGDQLGEQAFKHTGEGLARMAGWILKLAQSEPELVQVALRFRTARCRKSAQPWLPGPFHQPRQLDRFRDRFSPAGAKDDSRDAHVLADALRTDPRCLRRLEPLDLLLVELREWSRIAEELTRLRTRLSHRLRDQLWRAKYDTLRLKGHNHARALRSVAARLLAVACAMLASGTLFDPEHAVKQSAA